MSFFLENWQSLVSIVFVLVGFITSIISAVRSQRSQKAFDIFAQIAELCAEVESVLPNGFGDVKRGFVLRQIEKLCLAAHIPFDREKVLEQIEKVLSAPTKYKS